MKKFYYIIGLLITIFSSCDDYKGLSEDILNRGEITYLQKVDSVQIIPGNERVKFRFWYFNGNLLNKTVVFWNNRSDSVEYDLNLNRGRDSVDFILNVPADNYDFEILNKDIYDNKSLPVDIFSVVYGESYRKTLYNRSVKTFIREKNDNLTIYWYSTDRGFVFTELKYKNTKDEVVDMRGTADDKTLLKDFPENGEFQYRTAYIPEKLSIDTFYTDWSNPIAIVKK